LSQGRDFAHLKPIVDSRDSTGISTIGQRIHSDQGAFQCPPNTTPIRDPAVEAEEVHSATLPATAHAPHLYGLFLMLLMAFFPVAVLYALLPGKWTALLHYAKLFMAVKLWPFGWALLTAFTQRRPLALALADAASDLRTRVDYEFRIGDTPNLFATITLMYILVPAISFVIVQLVSHAASLPFQQAVPRPTGGNAAGAAGQAAMMAAE